MWLWKVEQPALSKQIFWPMNKDNFLCNYNALWFDSKSLEIWLMNMFCSYRQHELVFCYTIIEQNNRMMLPVATPTSNHVVLNLSFMNQLDSFFPFDPYLLRRQVPWHLMKKLTSLTEPCFETLCKIPRLLPVLFRVFRVSARRIFLGMH